MALGGLVLLLVLVGVCLATHWDLRAVPLALLLMLVIRPVATRLLLVGTPTTNPQRWLMGWFGIRGIGSLYYLRLRPEPRRLGSGRDRAGGVANLPSSRPASCCTASAHGHFSPGTSEGSRAPK